MAICAIQEDKLFNRKFAAIAISGLLVLGTSACSFTRDVPSLQTYAPSEGIDGDTANVALRNLIILTNGTKAELIGSLVNVGNKASSVSLEIPGLSAANFSLKAGEKLDIGYNGNAAIALSATGKAGDVETVKVTEGTQNISLNVPILDGGLSQYTDLVNSLGTAK
jgi:hypothetical protein